MGNEEFVPQWRAEIEALRTERRLETKWRGFAGVLIGVGVTALLYLVFDGNNLWRGVLGLGLFNAVAGIVWLLHIRSVENRTSLREMLLEDRLRPHRSED